MANAIRSWDAVRGMTYGADAADDDGVDNGFGDDADDNANDAADDNGTEYGSDDMDYANQGDRSLSFVTAYSGGCQPRVHVSAPSQTTQSNMTLPSQVSQSNMTAPTPASRRGPVPLSTYTNNHTPSPLCSFTNTPSPLGSFGSQTGSAFHAHIPATATASSSFSSMGVRGIRRGDGSSAQSNRTAPSQMGQSNNMGSPVADNSTDRVDSVNGRADSVAGRRADSSSGRASSVPPRLISGSALRSPEASRYSLNSGTCHGSCRRSVVSTIDDNYPHPHTHCCS